MLALSHGSELCLIAATGLTAGCGHMFLSTASVICHGGHVEPQDDVANTFQLDDSGSDLA